MSRLAVICLVVCLAVPAAARVSFSSAPKPNEIQAKYLDFVNEAGGLACQPKGKLKELLSEPNKCYLDLDECAPAKDALAGKLDPAIVAVFGDLLILLPGDKLQFAYACPGDDDPKFLEGLALQGIAYAKAVEHLDKLLALAAPARMKELSGANRELLANALIAMGPGQKEKTVPALAAMLKLEGRILGFKKVALQALARFGSDEGSAWCVEQLKSGEDKDVHMACVQYLGERKAAGSLEVMQRGFEKSKEETSRAMGALGDKAAQETLNAWVDDQGARSITVAAVGALANLGDAKAVARLAMMIEGKIPLSKKDEEKKAEETAKAKKPKDKDRVAKKWAEKETKVDATTAQAAAMESTVVTNPAAEAKLVAALKAAQKSKDEKEWKVRVYATLALAQRGDKAAVAEAAKLLSDPKEDIRKAALNAAGALYDSPGANFVNRGKGLVADAAMVPALLKYLENEPDKQQRTRAIHAIAAIRSFE